MNARLRNPMVPVGVGSLALWGAGELLIDNFSLPFPVVVLGLITGAVYGIVAVGLVLIHRASGVINFAHGEVGSFAAAAFGLWVVRYDLPYWLIVPVALGLGAATSMLVELVAVRRLRNAPRVMSIVATLGAGTFLLFLSLAVNTQIRRGADFPQPPFIPQFSIGLLVITPAYGAMLLLTPLIVAGLVAFLRYSRYGIGIRAAAENRDAALMAGISASRMSSIAWGIAGAIAAYAAILQYPQRGFQVGAATASLGPALLVRTLVPAVVARMSNIPVALGVGVVVGVIEQALLWNRPSGGQVEAVLFLCLLLVLLGQSRQQGRAEDQGSWVAMAPWDPLPDAVAQLPSLRWARLAVVGSVCAGLALILFTSNRNALVFTLVIGYALVGLSVYVVTGLTGQLSLGQFALAGIGIAISYRVVAETGNFFLGFLAAAAAAAAVSVVIGVPALRIRGLMLAVVTLGFAVMAEAWMFQQSWMFGSGQNPGRPIIGTNSLDTAKEYYAFILPWGAIGAAVAWNIARGGIGRSLRAVRDNEEVARSFSLRATRLKLQAFAVAGALAGLGGAVYGHSLPLVSSVTFPSITSVTVTAITVIGGLSLLAGPFIGALYLLALPAFVPLDAAGLAASTLGWLILILYFPGGIAQVLRPIRDRFVIVLARRAGVDLAAEEERSVAETQLRKLHLTSDQLDGSAVPAGLVLEVEGLVKHFGGVHAVDGVDLMVSAGETVGIIGPNGAGKTTLFEIIGGFVPPDEGTVSFLGTDITTENPDRRAARGLLRSFQDARLFPTLTVLECIELAHERSYRSGFGRQLVGLGGRAERLKESHSRELVNMMGLDRYRHVRVSALSTGTRRIAELACLIALEPKLLLLDEPSSGIAQRETEALAELLVQLKQRLGATFVIIEHDMPLIMGISDRIVAMDTGRVIAEGSPGQVRKDDRVISSYLGGNRVAIERSGVSSVEEELSVLLGGVAGLGPTRVRALSQKFGTVDALRKASERELLMVPGIGRATAVRICERLARAKEFADRG